MLDWTRERERRRKKKCAAQNCADQFHGHKQRKETKRKDFVAFNMKEPKGCWIGCYPVEMVEETPEACFSRVIE